jgi:hypothetical protein
MADLAECIRLFATLTARWDVLVHGGSFGVQQFFIQPGN